MFKNKHNLSLIITCLMLTNIVIFGVSTLLHIIDKNSFPWFAFPNKYGIASTGLYIFLLLAIFHHFIDKKEKHVLKIGDSLHNTNDEWNNEMCFSSLDIKRTFFSINNILTEEYIRKIFFKKHSESRDYIEIKAISELNFFFFRITTIKVKYNHDIT